MNHLSYFAEKTVELIEAGVSIIGGCCGTTPEHISAIRRVVDSDFKLGKLEKSGMKLKIRIFFCRFVIDFVLLEE